MNLVDKSKNKLKGWFSYVEKSVGPFAKIGITLAVLLITANLGWYLLSDRSEITNSTVMITTMAGNSGGSGSVIYSDTDKSLVLTNGHVCEIAVNGGLVKTTSGQSHTILGFKKSKMHDLCLISVAAKLPGKVSVSSRAPRMYEVATVSGHPALLPNVVTQGHFSGNKVIDVFMGIKPCTAEDKANSELWEICFFFGGIPVIRTYETVLVTATIMPGSSGSAIYNSSKELSSVVFAGSGDIGYAFAVPYEYVRMFLDSEVHTLTETKANYMVDIVKLLNNSEQNNNDKLGRKCKEAETTTDNTTTIKKVCDLILRDLDWKKIKYTGK